MAGCLCLRGKKERRRRMAYSLVYETDGIADRRRREPGGRER